MNRFTVELPCYFALSGKADAPILLKAGAVQVAAGHFAHMLHVGGWLEAVDLDVMKSRLRQQDWPAKVSCHPLTVHEKPFEELSIDASFFDVKRIRFVQDADECPNLMESPREPVRLPGGVCRTMGGCIDAAGSVCGDAEADIGNAKFYGAGT